MFRKSTETEKIKSDREQLIKFLQELKDDIFLRLDVNAYNDKELVTAINQMLDDFIRNNNVFVMRANDSMSKIGDAAVVKEMLEQVATQFETLVKMRESGSELDTSISNIQNSAKSILDSSVSIQDSSVECTENLLSVKEIVNNSIVMVNEIDSLIKDFRQKATRINEIIAIVKQVAQQSGLLALNASIEAAHAGEAGKGFAVVADEVKELSSNTTHSAEDVVKYVAELTGGIDALSGSVERITDYLNKGLMNVGDTVDSMNVMNSKVDSINEAISGINGEIDNQSVLTNNFVQGIDGMSRSYEILYNDCNATGRHMYTISRIVDNIRSDMARRNSMIYTQDWLNIFEVDHLIFTWRLYNNIEGFEKLKITQVNNPNGCKFGKWANAVTDVALKKSEVFKRCIKLHEELHNYACASWNAMDANNKEKALKQFELALSTYDKFRDAIQELKKYMYNSGNKAETDITRKEA